jgi:hypothetical protein
MSYEPNHSYCRVVLLGILVIWIKPCNGYILEGEGCGTDTHHLLRVDALTWAGPHETEPSVNHSSDLNANLGTWRSHNTYALNATHTNYGVS